MVSETNKSIHEGSKEMTDEMRIEAQLDARDRYFNEYDQYHFDEVSRTYFIWIDTKDTTKAEEIVKETLNRTKVYDFQIEDSEVAEDDTVMVTAILWDDAIGYDECDASWEIKKKVDSILYSNDSVIEFDSEFDEAA